MVDVSDKEFQFEYFLKSANVLRDNITTSKTLASLIVKV